MEMLEKITIRVGTGDADYSFSPEKLASVLAGMQEEILHLQKGVAIIEDKVFPSVEISKDGYHMLKGRDGHLVGDAEELELLRSAYSIAQRKGEETNWNAWTEKLEKYFQMRNNNKLTH